MRIAILGATGRTGKELVSRALAGGHEVNALARDPEKLGALLAKVASVKGDCRDPDAVGRLVAGASAVVSALGRVKGSAPDLMTVSARNVVGAMKTSGVGRLVVLTDTAVEADSDRPNLAQRLLRWTLPMVNPKLVADSRASARVVVESGLDWTLVRAPILTDGPQSPSWRASPVLDGMPLRVARADVAAFMLSCAVEGGFVRSMPVVAGARAS